ncbi:conserved hypothetical protein [Ricinus communis]|uniref:Uncharacterized protein n=1 Tax=Ricinus communis TaxID=3988 RepID=B9SE48_RICCO|nr:conserved hypothetical protein [Ricinus communis]
MVRVTLEGAFLRSYLPSTTTKLVGNGLTPKNSGDFYLKVPVTDQTSFWYYRKALISKNPQPPKDH